MTKSIITSDIDKQLRELVKQGKTQTEACRITKISMATIFRWAKRNNIHFHKNLTITHDIDKQLRRLAEQGKTQAQSSRITKVNRISIHYWAKRNGIKFYKKIYT